MAKWFVAAKKADFNKIAETFGISPVTARPRKVPGAPLSEGHRKALPPAEHPEIRLQVQNPEEEAKCREKMQQQRA